MLDKMPDLSVEQLIEQGKEQMIQALDKVENVEDVARMLHGLAQSASQMVQGVAAQNVGDVSRMLTTLGRSNKGAAGQMLQAALVNHRESALTLGAEPELGSEMMQKMASMSPASAVAIVKGLAAGNPTQAIQLLELLADTKEAEQLQDLLKDAGLPVNAAQIRMAKDMLEKLMQGNFNPMDALKSQLILLNIQAVLIFLFWVSFMLMGAYLFLGSEALLPQLVANVSAVGSAVTMIRSKSNELKSGDLKAIQSRRRYGSLVRAWRELLDPQGVGRVGQVKFCEAARLMGFERVFILWKVLDSDGSKFITLDMGIMVHGISLPALAQRPSRTEPVVFVFDSYFPGALMEFRHVCFREYGGLLEAFRYALDLDGSGTCRKPVLETGQHMAPQIDHMMPIFPGGVLCEESCVCLFAPGTLQSSSEAKFLANCDYTGDVEILWNALDEHRGGFITVEEVGFLLGWTGEKFTPTAMDRDFAFRGERLRRAQEQ
eukprot:g13857.t1